MVFHKYKLVITGVPKNASSSIFDTLSNLTDREHTHTSIIDEFSRNDVDLLETYDTLAVVRNPYDRFVSAVYQHYRDNPDNQGKNFSTIIQKDIIESNWVNDIFQPQSKYIAFGSHILVNHILKYENLNNDWEKFAIEYNKKSQFKIKTFLPKSNITDNRKNWKEELKEKFTQEDLDFINKHYGRDFKNFGYEIIEKIQNI